MSSTDPPPAIAGLRLADFLAAIASTEPSPGAGAAGAVALALGVACGRKAVRISTLHHPADDRLGRADAELAAIGWEACTGADTDATAFAALLAALQQPHDDPAEAAARSRSVHDRAAALVRSGERLVAAGKAAEALLATIEDRLDAVIANDVAAARTLIAAARAIAEANIAENRRLL